jgi:hypothetical protein
MPLNIFGLGAKLLEILIMKNLHEKIGRYIKGNEPMHLSQNLTSKDYIDMLKTSYLLDECEIIVDIGKKSTLLE